MNFERNPAFSLDKKRRDKKYIGAISLTRPLSESYKLMFSYSYTTNNSNVSDGANDPYRFKKNVYSLMITGMF